MSKPVSWITPPDRVSKWKKLWGTPRLLDQPSAEAAFEEFTDAIVPGHMHKLFLKSFGVPKAKFGNRFFRDEAQFLNWNTRLSHVGLGENTMLDAIVIYASTEKLEAHALKGESRRTLKDVIVDDWYGACAIVRGPSATAYIFIEPKMGGCIVRLAQTSDEEPAES